MNAPVMHYQSAPRVSIVIACFNAGDQLAACLSSIRALNIADLEVVVVDGGSQDHTLQVLQQEHVLSLQWVSEPDQGIYDALNKGVRLARGQWLHFLGTDDRLLPDFKQMVSVLQEADTLYYGNSKPAYRDRVRPSYELLGGPFSKYRIAKYCVNHQAILYPASVFQQYQYDPQYRIFADYALNIRLWGDPQVKRSWQPLDIVQYNMTGFSSLHTDRLFKQDKPALVRAHLGWWVYMRLRWKKFRKKVYGQPNW